LGEDRRLGGLSIILLEDESYSIRINLKNESIVSTSMCRINFNAELQPDETWEISNFVSISDTSFDQDDLMNFNVFRQQGFLNFVGGETDNVTINTFVLNIPTRALALDFTVNDVEDSDNNSTRNPTVVRYMFSGVLSWGEDDR